MKLPVTEPTIDDLIKWKAITEEGSEILKKAFNEELPSLVDTASMMRGDYLVLNQIEGAEAFNFIELLRDGSSGIGVIKASNIFDALKRLELKIAEADYSISVEEIKYMISEGFDYVIYQERFNDGSRKITGVAEIKLVDGKFDLELIYRN